MTPAEYAAAQRRTEPPIKPRRELSPEEWKKYARTWAAFMKQARMDYFRGAVLRALRQRAQDGR
jgi:hypothetical protein